MKEGRHPYRGLCVLLVGLATFEPAYATDYLVADQQEYRQAHAQLEAGDTIILANGEWRDFEIVLDADGTDGSPIRVHADGNVTRARVSAHRETPRLGDLIDSDKSDWIQQFTGRSLTDPDIATWGIKRDGGEFDQLTGATITPRAVVRAIRDTLVYYDENRTTVFAEANNDECGSERVGQIARRHLGR